MAPRSLDQNSGMKITTNSTLKSPMKSSNNNSYMNFNKDVNCNNINNNNNNNINNINNNNKNKIDDNHNNNDNSNNNSNNNSNINIMNDSSVHLLLQSQCSRILGVVLSLCSHTIRECTIGTNLSITGLGLSSLKNNKYTHKIKHHNDINFDKYLTSNDIIESFYDLNSSLFNNMNIRVTNNKKTEQNGIDYYFILHLFVQEKSTKNSNNNNHSMSFNNNDSHKKNSRLDLYELENIGQQVNTVLPEQYFTDPLKDPYLSVAIKNICKLFTSMEKLFILSPNFNSLHPNHSNTNNNSTYSMTNIQNQNVDTINNNNNNNNNNNQNFHTLSKQNSTMKKNIIKKGSSHSISDSKEKNISAEVNTNFDFSRYCYIFLSIFIHLFVCSFLSLYIYPFILTCTYLLI